MLKPTKHSHRNGVLLSGQARNSNIPSSKSALLSVDAVRIQPSIPMPSHTDHANRCGQEHDIVKVTSPTEATLCAHCGVDTLQRVRAQLLSELIPEFQLLREIMEPPERIWIPHLHERTGVGFENSGQNHDWEKCSLKMIRQRKLTIY